MKSVNKNTRSTKQISKPAKLPVSNLDDIEYGSIDIDSFDNQSSIDIDTESINNVTIIKNKSNKTSQKKVTTSVKKTNQTITNNNNNSRVVIYLDDDPAKPVTAGGVIIYKYVQNKMMVLIIEVEGKYEDIGGKIDPSDDDVFCAVAREVGEETNEMIKSEDIIDRLKLAQYIYVPKSKYVIYIVEATNNEKQLKKADFGDMENHDEISRTIGWIARDELMKPNNIRYKMNWRLKSKELFNQLIEIEKNVRYKRNLFARKSQKDVDDNNKKESEDETYTPGED